MRATAPVRRFRPPFSLGASLAVAPPALAAAKPPTAKESPVARAVARITAAGAYTTVEHLASPEYAGRLTGTGGYEAAAAWMAEECKRAGLQPVKALRATCSHSRWSWANREGDHGGSFSGREGRA